MSLGCAHHIRKARPQAPGYKVDPQIQMRIADVWRALAHVYVDSGVLREMYEALRRRDVNAAQNALPNLRDPNDPRARAAAERLMEITVRELKLVFANSADAQYKLVGSSLRVEKAAKPRPNRFVEVPHNDEFIRQRAAKLVVDIADEQRENLREVLLQRFDPDVRPENTIRDIKWVVGLTNRETNAVLNREDDLRDAGLSEDKVQRETQRYSDTLHQLRAERIARTETVAIESEARQTAWEVAQSDGLVSKDAGKEWVASRNACDECQDLDGIVVPLDGFWESAKFGRVRGSPLHPQCECMQVLRTGE